MSRRSPKAVTAALLMTTALAWQLPAGAQTSSGGSMGSTPSATSPARPADAGGSSSGSGLPAGFVPAMPASAAQPAGQAAAKEGDGFGPGSGKSGAAVSPQPAASAIKK